MNDTILRRTARSREGSVAGTSRCAYSAFHALTDITLSARSGEAIGLVGGNGAGKSTLLQVIAGLYHPDSGIVDVNGRVAAILNLNTGFKQELTGIENLRLRGLMLGLSLAEVDRLIPEIVEFCDIDRFIDQPVRTYSSGMLARLGFAISTAVKPDILLLDEILGVGDAAFAERSKARLESMIESTHLFFLCSHNMETIASICNRTIWLHDGAIHADGPTDKVLPDYMAFMQAVAEELEERRHLAAA